MRQVLFLIGCLSALVTFAAPESYGKDLQRLAGEAVAEDPAVSQKAITILREAGPAGLAALFSVHRAMLGKHGGALSAKADSHNSAVVQRLKRAVDMVGGQYDCAASRLFWYTDLERAKAAARRDGKPILSLRLLGKLTDEYSCANSRFFRTVLYANREVSRVLREQFVLHWKSVRPVPTVTIDFGDGRQLRRTLTGNSIHYILDAKGRPVEALPGLYGPQAFLQGLKRARQLVGRLEDPEGRERQPVLRRYHRRRFTALIAQWRGDLQALGIAAPDDPVPNNGAGNTARPQASRKSQEARPTAVVADGIAMTKSIVERPVLLAISPNAAETLARATNADAWRRIAQRHADEARLDAGSIALIHAHRCDCRQADCSRTQPALKRVVRNFEKAIAVDTVRNEYVLHRQIHEWFATGEVNGLALLNERVYAELFLTPGSDPWLGLKPADSYTALENGGVAE